MSNNETEYRFPDGITFYHNDKKYLLITEEGEWQGWVARWNNDRDCWTSHSEPNASRTEKIIEHARRRADHDYEVGDPMSAGYKYKRVREAADMLEEMRED